MGEDLSPCGVVEDREEKAAANAVASVLLGDDEELRRADAGDARGAR